MAKRKKNKKTVNLESLMNFLKEKSKENIAKMGKWELIMFHHLKDLHYKFECQVPVIVKNQGFILDFFLPDSKIFIEIDSRQFHSSKSQIASDNKRTKLLKTLGYTPLRFTNRQITLMSKETIHQIIQSRINQIVK